jgi:hypothetical protein
MHEDAARRAEEAIAKQAKWHHRIEVAPGVVTPDLTTWTAEKSTALGR